MAMIVSKIVPTVVQSELKIFYLKMKIKRFLQRCFLIVL